MVDEQTNSEQSAPEPKPTEIRIIEGYQPPDFVKGHDVTEFGQQPSGDTIIRGYTPETSGNASSVPPQGGSGVPPAQVQSTSSSESTGQAEQTD